MEKSVCKDKNMYKKKQGRHAQERYVQERHVQEKAGKT